jgi:hypothetical protein
VSCIVVEPPNTGSAILDKLGYLLQEEGVQLGNWIYRNANFSRISERQPQPKRHYHLKKAAVQARQTRILISRDKNCSLYYSINTPRRE